MVNDCRYSGIKELCQNVLAGASLPSCDLLGARLQSAAVQKQRSAKNEWSQRHFKGRLQSEDIFHLIKSRASCFGFVISHIYWFVFLATEKEINFPKQMDLLINKQSLWGRIYLGERLEKKIK